MKKILYVTLGISGSGKSTLINTYKAGREAQGLQPATIVCPDQIRKELTGSISDQSQNDKVFGTAYQRTRDALKHDGVVIFDSTALNSKTRKELIDIAHKAGAVAALWILKDSGNPELCRDRVINDIKSGVDRADTQRQDIIDRMYQSYQAALRSIPNENWDYVAEK